MEKARLISTMVTTNQVTGSFVQAVSEVHFRELEHSGFLLLSTPLDLSNSSLPSSSLQVNFNFCFLPILRNYYSLCIYILLVIIMFPQFFMNLTYRCCRLKPPYTMYIFNFFVLLSTSVLSAQ